MDEKRAAKRAATSIRIRTNHAQRALATKDWQQGLARRALWLQISSARHSMMQAQLAVLPCCRCRGTGGGALAAKCCCRCSCCATRGAAAGAGEAAWRRYCCCCCFRRWYCCCCCRYRMLGWRCGKACGNFCCRFYSFVFDPLCPLCPCASAPPPCGCCCCCRSSSPCPAAPCCGCRIAASSAATSACNSCAQSAATSR